MNSSDSEQIVQTMVQVRPGCRHPVLGAIGGWEGAVLRSFNVGGATYIDVEVSTKTIAGLGSAERGKYYNGKIVFTRLRVAQKDAQPIPTPVIQRASPQAMAQSQQEWFNEVGAHQHDPTKFVADRAAPEHYDAGRRQAIRTLVGFGSFILITAALSRSSCNSDNSGNSGTGSWGRSGGFSS